VDAPSEDDALAALFALPPPQLTCEPIYGTQYEVTPLPAPWLQASVVLFAKGGMFACLCVRV
jgi:hypothetical protein